MSPAICAECGARAVADAYSPEGADCFGLLGRLIAREAEDPALAALHFYLVAGYNLQHPAAFTDDAHQGLLTLFCEAVDQGWSNAEALKAARRAKTGQGKVLAPERRPRPRSWPMTLADVWLPEQTSGAAMRVKAWAAAIRESLP